jgi:hypothetical protein
VIAARASGFRLASTGRRGSFQAPSTVALERLRLLPLRLRMGLGQWARVLDTMSGLAELAGRVAGSRAESPRERAGSTPAGSAGPIGPLGHVEARLTGVLVAALKEAFERDSARLELERAQQESEDRRREAEQRRLDEALTAELRRQAETARRQSADRALAQLRTVALLASGAWALSAVLAVLVPGMRANLPRILLGLGWLLAIGAIGAAFDGVRRVSAWSRESAPDATLDGPPSAAAADAAPWLLVTALAAIAVALLVAL